MINEDVLRSTLTLQNYIKWFQRTLQQDIREARCGTHVWWVIEALGLKQKEYAEYKTVRLNDIPTIISLLDKGHLINFLHNYSDGTVFTRLRKDNRYGNHEFQIIKAGDKYFLSQGFENAYLHSLVGYTRPQIEQMLKDIIEKLSDYTNTKRWGDLDASLYKKYFKTDLQMYPNLPLNTTGKVHNVVLQADIY
jgi:hypothetical protein